MISRLQRLLAGKRYRFIIVGVDFDAYQLYEAVTTRLRRATVLFFIDDEPWNHRTRIGTAQLRYPAELPPLVERHRIDGVLCADRQAVAVLPESTLRRLANGGCPLLVKAEDVPLEAWVDSLPARLNGEIRNPETS